MSKILCLYSYKTSSWVSCQKIVANLWLNYKEASEEVNSLHYGVEQKGQDLIHLAEKIIDEKPDTISFIDHRPHPLELLQYLVPMWMQKFNQLPEFIFHIYGDFTLNYGKWASLARILKGAKLKFCVASSAQKKLMQKLYEGEIFLHPFSVRTDEFYYCEKLRLEFRKELGVTEEKIFIFTGRLSYQKNIHLLVKHFLEHVEASKSNDKLLLFGNFDDLGDPFVNHRTTPGEYFHQVQRILQNHPKRKQIEFKGMANSKTLNAYYNASDYFIGLSMHNDEDFGMSIAESSICGLPSILTAWGGFHDFNFPGNHFLKVKIEEQKEIMLQPLAQMLSRPNTADRSLISKKAHAQFSTDSTTQNLKKILNSHAQTFEGFSNLFHRVQKSSQISNKMFINFDRKLNSLYREIYDSYIG